MIWLVLAVNLTITPGVVRLVIQADGLVGPLTTAQVCATRWGLDHRFVTLEMKQDVFRRYGVPWADRALYETDHLIPRELGGADDILNLWPEPWPDARRKDRLENRLHAAVCAGLLTLPEAQDRARHYQRFY